MASGNSAKNTVENDYIILAEPPKSLPSSEAGLDGDNGAKDTAEHTHDTFSTPALPSVSGPSVSDNSSQGARHAKS